MVSVRDASVWEGMGGRKLLPSCRICRLEPLWCSGPKKPESYPRTYPNPRMPEDNPGPDPLDPGDHRPGPRVPPRYPRRAPAWSTRSPRPGECPALP